MAILVPKMLRPMVRHLGPESADHAQFLLPTRVLPAEVAKEPPFQAPYLMVSTFVMMLNIWHFLRVFVYFQ